MNGTWHTGLSGLLAKARHTCRRRRPGAALTRRFYASRLCAWARILRLCWRKSWKHSNIEGRPLVDGPPFLLVFALRCDVL
jgi:hypothetical protein